MININYLNYLVQDKKIFYQPVLNTNSMKSIKKNIKITKLEISYLTKL